MATSEKTGTFDAPADAIWKTISDFGGIGKYVPGITDCTVEGSGVGSVRRFSIPEAGEIVERLQRSDEQERVISYSIESSPLPVEGCVETVVVRDLGGGRCEVRWSGTFEPKGVPEEVAVKAFTDFYDMAFEGIRKLHS